MTARHSIFPCTVDDGTPRNLTQMEGFSTRTNSQKSSIVPGGSVDRAHIGLASASPGASFTTRDLAGIFAILSATVGLNCTGGATFRRQLRADGSTFATGTSHETYVSTKGFLRPMSLAARQGDTDGALLTLDYSALWDGTNKPWVHNTGVDFAGAPAPAFGSRFFAGPVYHNSVILPSIEGWSLDFGINYAPRAFNGNTYAKVGSILTRTPRLTLTTADSSVGAAIDVFISAINTSMAFYLQKGADSSDRVAAATAQHLKVTVSAGEWGLDEDSVQGNDDGSSSFTIQPTGTIALVTNSAIP